MRILAVDDEVIGLKAPTKAIKTADPAAEIAAFNDPDEALNYIRENKCEIAFLDIFLPGTSGIDLAKQIKIINAATRIVFATGYDDYMKDAFQLHASGYVLKPVTAAKIREELKNISSIKESIVEEMSLKDGKKIVFQCFGNFEAFYNGKPLHFKYDKTKELLAYIVSRRGALCSNGEIIVNLWEDDKEHDSYLRGIRKDLLDNLREKGVESIINQQRGKIGINVNELSCDYYDFLNGDVSALNKYNGEFMYQYHWGEMVNAEIIMG